MVLEKKGMRSKIELMENLRGKKGLTKRKTNILGGNFNFVENPYDRKLGGDENFVKEKNIREYFSVLSTNFSLHVSKDLMNKIKTIVVMNTI